MTNFSIGISGLSAAQAALDVIGNNIANAATEGYHRQRIELDPAYSSQTSSVFLGGGVDVAGVTRLVDNLLEQEILRQQSLLGQVGREFSTLRTVESAFGELSAEGGLSSAIDDFFGALQELSAHPGEAIWQNQVVSVAEAMAGKFRTIGEFFNTLEAQITLEAENTMEEINTLINQIAELNNNIKRLEIGGATANNLRDKRDQRIAELAELIGVETVQREYGVVDVSAGGIGVVIGTSAVELELGLVGDGGLGITIAGASNYSPDVQGGRLGGLLSLNNELVSDINDDLDDLALAIIQRINEYHVQGVGSEGSFSELTGWVMIDEDLADFDPPVTNGKVYIRVIDTSTGEITRNEIDVDVSTDSLTTIAAKISLIDGLSASVVSSKLHIQGDAGYEFDFLPAVLPEPTNSTLTGSPPTISVSGIYSGTENQTFTFTVLGTGSVGNGTLQLEVQNGSAEVVTTLNVGSGYAAGDELDIGNGIKVSLSMGDLNDSETFEVDAFAETDTSGFLAAAGMNTFFSGDNASNMSVCSEVAGTPGLVATALGADMTDNTNALRLAGVRDEAISSLDSMTVGQFYRRLITDLGQELSVKEMGQESIQVIIQNLSNQQSEISGVNINDEAAKLLVFEQMFQAMAKYISTIQSSMASIMELI